VDVVAASGNLFSAVEFGTGGCGTVFSIVWEGAQALRRKKVEAIRNVEANVRIIEGGCENLMEIL
jgi:hypothetical protein